MKRKMCVLLIGVITLFASCSNDFEVWDNGFGYSWNEELNNIVSDFDYLFKNSNIKFIRSEKIDSKVDSLDFFTDDTYFPVCFDKLYNFILLQKINFLANDTVTIHMPSLMLKKKVSQITNNQDQYDMVKIYWAFQDEPFYTIAAFDKKNGQIIFDNILTNIPFFMTSTPNRNSKLTRSEGGAGGSSDTRIFYRDIWTYTYGSFDEYKIMVKALCTIRYVHDDRQNCWNIIRTYKTVNYSFIEPTYYHYNVNCKGEVAKVGDNIIGYIWVGEGYCPFNSSAYFNCSDAYNYCLNGYSWNGNVWALSVNQTIDLWELEENPSSGEWAF